MKTFYPRLFRVPGPPSPMQTNIKLTNKPPAHDSSCFPPGWTANLKSSCAVPSLLSKERPHGHDRLERPPHLWPDFDARPHVCRGPRRTNQFKPAPQRLPFAPQAALVLSCLQSQRGTLRNCEGLRVRKGSIRAVQRRGARQDRAFLGARHGNFGVREAE